MNKFNPFIEAGKVLISAEAIEFYKEATEDAWERHAAAIHFAFFTGWTIAEFAYNALTKEEEEAIALPAGEEITVESREVVAETDNFSIPVFSDTTAIAALPEVSSAYRPALVTPAPLPLAQAQKVSTAIKGTAFQSIYKRLMRSTKTALIIQANSLGVRFDVDRCTKGSLARAIIKAQYAPSSHGLVPIS